MRKRILVSMLALCMILTILPTRSIAVDDLLNGDSGQQNAGEPVSLDIADGSITFTESGYTHGTSTTETAYTGAYTVTQTGDSSTANTITVESGVINMTISGLNVVAANAPAIHVKAGATLNLTVGETNSLTGGPGFAAICVEAAYDEDWNYDAEGSAKLYISGSGDLTAVGGDGDSEDGTYGGGAGIGGNGEDQDVNGVDFGLICVESTFTGTIDATGGAASALLDDVTANFGGGAGIGGGGFNMGYIDANSFQSLLLYGSDL